MSVTISVNGLSLVHRGSGGVSSATLPDVCITPPQQAPVPYPNVAVSRDLAGAPDSVRVDGGQPPAHAASNFRMSRGDEAGALGGVASGTVAGRATWLTCSPNVRIEGRGACRLTDKMLHNSGNTLNCAGLTQEPVLGQRTRTLARAAAASPAPPHEMEIALPFLFNPTRAPLPDNLFGRAEDLGVTYFRLFHYWLEGEPIDVDKPGVEMIKNAGFGVEMSIQGTSSPWAQRAGRDCHGVLPSPKAFAAYFLACVKLYFPLGVTRFSVWNEPNHSGFLRAGVYWQTAHAKKRIKTVRDLKRKQDDLGKAAHQLDVEAKKAEEEGRPDEVTQKHAAAAALRVQEKASNDEADRVWKKRLKSKDLDAIERSERRKGKRRPRSAYKLFDLKANAILYRKLYLAAYNAIRKDGALGPKLATGELQLWIGELASSEAFKFLSYLFDPAVTGKRGCLRAHGLALHPYQYLVPPTKPPNSQPKFLAKVPPPPGATPDQIKYLNERNAAIDRAKQKKWPNDDEARATVKEHAAQSAGIGALLRVQSLLRRLAREKLLAKPKHPASTKKYEKADLYLTEFGYHRERLEKIQADRQVPDTPPAGQALGRRGLWIQLAMQRAVEAKVRQTLYYHLTYSGTGHEWDSGIVAPGDQPDPAFYAFKAWVEKNPANVKDEP